MKVTCPMCHGTRHWNRSPTEATPLLCPGCGGNGWQEDKQSTGWPAWPTENRRIDSLERRVTALEQKRKPRA